MAYNQQPRYEASQRPQYGHSEASYDSSRSRGHPQPNARPGYGYDDGYGGKPAAQSYTDQYGAQEDRSYDPEYSSGAPAQYQGRDDYRGRDHQTNRDHRPDQRAHARPAEAAGYAPDSRHRGAPQPDLRPTVNSHHANQRQHRHQQPREPRPPQGRGQLYDRYQNVVPSQAAGGYGYGEVYEDPRQDWQEPQTYEPAFKPARNLNHSNGLQDGYHQPASGYDGGYDQGRTQDKQHNVQQSRYDEPEIANLRPPKSAAKVEEPKPVKQAPKQNVENVKSPDTVAWDNPFPTFPAVKPHLKGLSDERDHDQDGNGESRPHTANSKSSYGSAHRDGARDESFGKSELPPHTSSRSGP